MDSKRMDTTVESIEALRIHLIYSQTKVEYS